jgi:acyl carrier protein
MARPTLTAVNVNMVISGAEFLPYVGSKIDWAMRGPREPRPMNHEIRTILQEHGRLSVDLATLEDDSDLYQAGMTSHASVNVMLALEGKFDIEFPDRMLKRGVFGSIASIRAAIEELAAPR